MVGARRDHRGARSPLLPRAAARWAEEAPRIPRAALRVSRPEHLVRHQLLDRPQDRRAAGPCEPDPRRAPVRRAAARVGEEHGRGVAAPRRRSLSLHRAGVAMGREIGLRYGINPDRGPAKASRETGLPFSVLNGEPSYVNLLDALNAWQLVRELRAATGSPAAASFKHVSPAGAAIAGPVSPPWAYAARSVPESPLASAYLRARGADRLAAFGDIASFSETVDAETAEVLRREVSDGAIAPGYEKAALETLRRKRGGRYLVLEIDPRYEPKEVERREVFGVTLEQRRDSPPLSEAVLKKIPTKHRELPANARRDLVVALIAAKYAQSNSVVMSKDGQAIGVGAGQQSRVACVRLAADKARTWWLRRHPRIATLDLDRSMSRPDRDNAIDEAIRRVPAHEVTAWLGGLSDVSPASDCFFPFRDNVDVAASVGVRYIAQPGGSERDAEIVAACDEHGIVMAMTGVRLFHH